MQMYLICDNVDTLTGMRLAGVDGVVLHKKEECREELQRVLHDPNVGILLITELLANLLKDELTEVKQNRKIPLVVEIPDRHGTGRAPDFITSYVRTAIGLKL